MPSGRSSSLLPNGETLTIAEPDHQGVYDKLWQLARKPGAVSTAALLMRAWRLHRSERTPVVFTTQQSAVLRRR